VKDDGVVVVSRELAPLRGSGAAAILACLRPAPPPAASDADHIVTQRGDGSIDGVSIQARSGGLRWGSVMQNA
jgi:hypothetical protein